MQTLLLTVASLATILVIGWLDVATGPEYGLSLFYLLPIAVTALRGGRGGRRGAALAGVFAAGIWTAAELMTSQVSVLASVWNGATRLAIYVGVGLLLATQRRDQERLETLAEELRVVLARESNLARTDALTGVANSRYLRESLEREVARSHRDGHPVALAYIDLDNFKGVNDAQGHAGGDALLCSVARALRETVRSTDQVGRMGGDEFAALLVDADGEQAAVVMRRFAARMRQIARAYPEQALGASIGIASAHGSQVSSDTLIREADAAMYEAKAAGKNALVVRQSRSEESFDRAAPETFRSSGSQRA